MPIRAKKKRPVKIFKKKSGKNKKSNMKLQVVLVIIAVIITLFAGLFIGFQKENRRITSGKKLNLTRTQMVSKKNLPTESVKVPILVFHYVEYVKDTRDTIRKSLSITPATFEAQIKTLMDAGYTFITVRELGNYLDGKRKLPLKPVILTFDDGYGDFYTDVFPILKKYNVVSTAYVVSGFIDRLNYVTSSQLKEVVESGIVEIGAHTVHHPNLTSLTFEWAKKEIEDSKFMLEKEYGINVDSFAYPYGGFNLEVAKIVADSGFTTAVTTKGGLIVNQENRYILFRIHPGGAIGNGLLKML